MLKKKIETAILKSITPEKVYLIGYRDQMQSVNIFHGQEITGLPDDIFHIDLLIIGIPPNVNTIANILADLREQVNSTVMLLHPELFNSYLEKGIYFAVHPAQCSPLIFEKKDTLEAWPNYEPTNAWKYEAERTALHIYKAANEFLAAAGRYPNSKKTTYNFSFYFLTQALELYLRAAIMRVLGIELKAESSIRRLIQITRWAITEIESIFDLSQKKDKELQMLFNSAYNQVLFDRHFTIKFDQLLAARRKVNALRTIVIKLLENVTPKSSMGIDNVRKDEAEGW